MGQSSTTDTFTLNLSEDAYKGDAQFTVTMDGVPLGAACYAAPNRETGAIGVGRCT